MASPRAKAGDALRCGDRSAAVTEIPRLASRVGDAGQSRRDLNTGRHVALDVFDADSTKPCAQFQQHRGLLVDGMVGEATTGH